MKTAKVGVREFREKLATYIEGDSMVAVTRHGETVGIYIPTRRPKPTEADIEALRVAGARVDAELAALGLTEDELVEEFKQLLSPKALMLALDANILVRAILGNRVRKLIEQYARTVGLLMAHSAVEEARRHLPEILLRRGANPESELKALDRLLSVLEVIEPAVYSVQEGEAKLRLATRDIDDWPTAAIALTFNCAIWTEDQDFFGCGIPTWTTDRVEIFLRSRSPNE